MEISLRLLRGSGQAVHASGSVEKVPFRIVSMAKVEVEALSSKVIDFFSLFSQGLATDSGRTYKELFLESNLMSAHLYGSLLKVTTIAYWLHKACRILPLDASKLAAENDSLC